MSEVLPFLRLDVLVVDGHGDNVRQLIHVIEDHELVQSVRFSDRVGGRSEEPVDALFLNPFEVSGRGSAITPEHLRKLNPTWQLVLFCWPGQMEGLLAMLSPEMRAEVILALEPEPTILLQQVDEALQKVWEARYGRRMRRAEPASAGSGAPASARPGTKRATSPRPSSAPSLTPDEQAPADAAEPIPLEYASPAARSADATPSAAEVQERLIQRGYRTPRRAILGDAGLEEAVRAFQREEGLQEDGDVGPQTISRLFPEFPTASERSHALSQKEAPDDPDAPATAPPPRGLSFTEEPDAAIPAGTLPLSASAQPAVRNAVAYHRAALGRMPFSIALLAGIVAVAEADLEEDTADAGHEDTAFVLRRFLRERRPGAKDMDLLGLGEYGISRQPAPLPPFGELLLSDPAAEAERQRILKKASRYARQVHPAPESGDVPLLTSVRHLLAALLTDEEPRFPVPAHLEEHGYSLAELRPHLFAFFTTLWERTEVWREILRPIDRLPPPSASRASVAGQNVQQILLETDEWEESFRPQEPVGQGQLLTEELDEAVPPAEYLAFEPTVRDNRALRFAEEAPAAEYESDEAAGRDLLNLKSEVNALSAVLASRELRPPLSVGLFGDWGTGKSFFMGLMRRRIRQLSFDARSGRTNAFCPRIVQITFNAWHYMDANLWASLVSGVFDGLARALSTGGDRPAAVRERLLARLAENHVVLAQAEQRKLAAEHAILRAQEKLQQLGRQKSGLQAVLGSGRDVIHVAVRQPEVTSKLVGLAQDVGLPESAMMNIGAHREALESRAQRLRVLWRIVTGQEGDRRRLLFTGLFAVLIIGLGFLGYWLVGQVRGASGAVQVAASIIGALIGVGTQVAAQLRPLYQKLADAAPRLQEIVQQAETLGDGAARRMDEPAAEARRRLEQLEAEEAAARDAHAQAVRQVQQVDEEIQEIRAGRRLHRFISERSAAQDYRRHLGIVALVRDDFQRLSQLLGEARTGADGELPPVDRIILYIDDLDRCPEKRVVEVLQAVHLLLAFPLFVVVVGVDSRWLLRSVQSHYAQLIAGGEGRAGVNNPEEWASTPQNYLEKIFQIPFTLRPMNSDEYASLVQGLVPLPGDREQDGPPEHQAGHDDEEWVDFPEDPVLPVPAAPQRPETVADADASPVAAVESETSTGASGVGLRGIPAYDPATLSDPLGRSDDPDAQHSPQDRAETEAGQAPAESEAQSAVRAAEQGLAMARHERAFLQALSPLIPSPRSAKRLVNVYRFIRASLAPAELASFVGRSGETGHHQSVALLLAIITGFPTQAVYLFRGLESERAAGAQQGWWEFFEALAPPEVDAAHWEQLRQALAAVKEKAAPDLPLEQFVRWAPHVARFSFQTGQLFARRHG